MRETSGESQMESRLLKAAQSGAETVRVAAEQLVGAGGKRLRPKFARAFGEAIGAPPQVAETIGAAVELLHTGSLIHDDVIDRSELRRNQPALHMKIGVAKAVLTGDFLLARSLEEAAKDGLWRAMGDLAQGLRELVEAEVLQQERAFDADTTLEHARAVAAGKTGALFACCARALAREHDMAAHAIEAADRIGRAFGVGFQVADDLLDFAGESAGKPQRKDLREGQFTLPMLLAAHRDPSLRAAVGLAFASRADQHYETAYGLLCQSEARALGISEIERYVETIASEAALLLPPAAAAAFANFCKQHLEFRF